MEAVVAGGGTTAAPHSPRLLWLIGILHCPRAHPSSYSSSSRPAAGGGSPYSSLCKFATFARLDRLRASRGSNFVFTSIRNNSSPRSPLPFLLFPLPFFMAVQPPSKEEEEEEHVSLLLLFILRVVWFRLRTPQCTLQTHGENSNCEISPGAAAALFTVVFHHEAGPRRRRRRRSGFWLPEPRCRVCHSLVPNAALAAVRTTGEAKTKTAIHSG